MTIRNPQTSFDPETHRYTINDRPAVSVTRVMDEMLGQPYRSSEWHMQRGRVVHACAAMIGKGIEFDYDPQIEGQVAAARKFHNDFCGTVLAIEEPFYSVRYQYAGTVDRIQKLVIPERPAIDVGVIIDFKATLTRQTEVQLGGYSVLTKNRWGMGVQLNDDGTYKCSPVYDLRRPAQEFLSLLSAYGTKARLGMLSKQEEDPDED